MPVSVHELTEYISWASDDYLHLALSDGTDGKITKANIVSGLTGADALDVYYVKRSNNLSDIANPALARANLNLGSVALLNQITKADIVDFSDADYATAAQGLLAESALQAGDNISELVNDAGYIPSSQKGVANGVASLDSNGKIPETQVPAIAITDTFVVDSEAEMLALDAQVGDVAIRNDESQSYILQGTDPSDLSDWQELKTPTTGVTSVNGQTGTVVLNADDIDDTSTIHKFATSAQLTKIDSVETGAQVNTVNSVAGKTGNVTLVKADVGLSNVDNTSDLAKPISAATQTALDGKQATITGAATTITGSNLTASRALISNASGKVAASSVTSSEVAHLSGVTSSIQGQIDSKANSSVNLTAGTGLTGGGDLTADRTFAVVYGTTAGTSAQGNDTRLSNAREWTATTVSQAEAEAGTATTRRAWTAQRVFQAIAAWWNASSAKTKLDGIETGAEVNQNAFTTIAVPGRPDVVADSKTDTVTFVGGTGVNISTDPATDTITFEATGVGTGSIEEVIAGSGLIGGGTTSTVTLNVGAGTGITVAADTVGLDTANTRNVDHSSVSITAGTGLTGGGDLTATRTLNVSYGTTAGTAAQGNDSRLSDSREWTATTISQAEAETGTATTRRAWTAQRVRQAIVAWWNTVGTTVGKALLNLANPGGVRFIRLNADNTATTRTSTEFRADLGMGTAATANVTTSATDATTGRVLTVGYGGLHVPTSITDFSSLSAGRNRNILFSSLFSPTERPVAVNYFSGIVLGHDAPGSAYESMLVFGASDGETAGALHLRNKVADVWQPWRRVLDSRSVVTGDGDTTSTRIPTVGWVQANAGGSVESVNGILPVAGDVTLTASDVGALEDTYAPSWSDVTGKPSFSTVATTGAYSDLTGKPALGTASSADLTTSTSDTTTGRVLTVGYGGLNVPTPVADFSALAVGQNKNVLFRTPFAPTERPTTVNYFSGIAFGHDVAGHESVLAVGASDSEAGGALYLRNKVVDVWQDWRRILDSKSLVTGNEDTTASRIPTAGWVLANAASTDVATTSANGLMSSTDKTKLNGIAIGAEVNQNAFTTIAVSGQSAVVADSKTDTLTFAAGSGITLTTNATTDTVTIAATGSGTVTEVVAGSGLIGGGTSSTVVLSVGEGDGISVTANTVAVNSTVVRTTGTQSIGGTKTFTSEVTAPSFNTTSSLKYKTDIGEFENALEKLMAIDVITYKRKIPEGEPQDDKVYLGVSAESLAKVVPELVRFKDGEPDSVNYAQGFALCVKAIQELVEELKKQ